MLSLFKGEMGRLLLRADKTDTFPTRVDVLFMNTQFLRIPTVLEGLSIRDVTNSAEGDMVSRDTGLIAGPDTRFYKIISGSGIGFIVAGSVTHVEDKGEYWEPSQFVMDP
jgi:hypothetical protein